MLNAYSPFEDFSVAKKIPTWKAWIPTEAKTRKEARTRMIPMSPRNPNHTLEYLKVCQRKLSNGCHYVLKEYCPRRITLYLNAFSILSFWGGGGLKKWGFFTNLPTPHPSPPGLKFPIFAPVGSEGGQHVQKATFSGHLGGGLFVLVSLVI